MKSASLRQRAVELLNTPIGRWLRGTPAELPALPPYTSQLYKLAHIAIGDADSAAVLAADVVARQLPASKPDEGQALRMLVKLLPEGWLSWPGAAGPGEWLRLGLRREQADRLLSVLGEWDAPARIALGLWLLAGVRRDDLDQLLGMQGMADRMSEFVGYVGEGLDLIPPLGDRPACQDVAPDLLDAQTPHVGRLVRLHILGCDACRKRVGGLQATVRVLREALETFFRVPMPPDLARLVVIRQRQMRQPPLEVWKPVVIVAVLLLLYVGVVRKPAATAAPAPGPSNAAELLKRALHRFEVTTHTQGILHERARLRTSQGDFIIERWYDYTPSNRLRVTAWQDGIAAPLLDLTSDGIQQIAYEVNPHQGTAQRALFRHPGNRQLMPLLRQLPVVGSFGDALVPQQHLDLNLLAAAKRGRPTLLGANKWHGRGVYTIASTTDSGERLILTLDQETFSLVEGRIATTVGSGGTARNVWQAEVVEVLARKNILPTTFQIKVQPAIESIANPRQFTLPATSLIDLDNAIASSVVAIPTTLPEQPPLAYLRDRSRVRTSIVQFYEGLSSTLAVEAPRFAEPLRRKSLELRFAHGDYTVVKHDVPQTTILVFTMDDAPDRRMRLYLWHAGLTDQERAALSRTILDSLVLTDRDNVDNFRSQFIAPSATTTSNVEAFPEQNLRISVTGVNPRRRFGRFKADQALAHTEGASSAIEDLTP